MTAQLWFKSILTRRKMGPLGAVVLSPLAASATLWGMVLQFRRDLYRCGVLKAIHAGVPTICVGNLTLGGTGKTPCVEVLCRMLLEMGENPAIVSRGYGGTSCAKVATVSDGTKLYLSAREAGDEPVLLARRLPGIPVVIGANRVEAAAEAVFRWGATVLVTDDGFQHLRLKRDINVVVMDATAPFGNGYVLPRGMLREPSSALRDADLIVLTRSGGVAPEELEELREKLGRLSLGAPVVQSVHEFAALRDWPDGVEKEPKKLSGQKILAFAGIGNPEAFFSEIDRLGAQLVETAPFPDHHVYTKGDMDLLLNRARRANADRLVTTEKDAVKIEPFLPLALPLGVLTLRMGFPPADIRHLETLLKRVVQTGRTHVQGNAE